MGSFFAHFQVKVIPHHPRRGARVYTPCPSQPRPPHRGHASRLPSDAQRSTSRASLPQLLPNGPPSSPSGVSVPVQRSSFWPLTSHASSVTSSTRSQSCGSTLSTRPRTATSHSRWLTLSGSAPL